MRDWLIRKLGGIPKPPYPYYMDNPTFEQEESRRNDLIMLLGGVPLPKAGEGQHVVGPVVRKNPVRTKKGMEELGKRTGALVIADSAITAKNIDQFSNTLAKLGVFNPEGGELLFESPEPRKHLCNECTAVPCNPNDSLFVNEICISCPAWKPKNQAIEQVMK
jgi:hypothetical protein